MAVKEQKGKMTIQTKELRKSFGNRQILNGVELELNPGEVICITGANGSGKSTLIRILSTLLRPDGGELLIDGEDPFENLLSLRTRMGVLLHEPMLYVQLTARENLKYISRIYRLKACPRRKGDGRSGLLDTWLEKTALIDFADERVADFSSGMRQRLAIARTMMHSPELLLLDEPFSSLDQGGIEFLIKSVREHLARGSSAVVVSHMSWLLERLSNLILNLSEGKLKCSGHGGE